MLLPVILDIPNQPGIYLVLGLTSADQCWLFKLAHILYLTLMLNRSQPAQVTCSKAIFEIGPLVSGKWLFPSQRLPFNLHKSVSHR